MSYDIRYSRPSDRAERNWVNFIKGAPVPLLFGILVPALLTCSRPSGQDLLFDWQRKLVEIAYYITCLIYFYMSFKNAFEGRYPRAIAYLLAPISAAVIRLTQPDSCTLLNHWRDLIWYESNLRNFF